MAGPPKRKTDLALDWNRHVSDREVTGLGRCDCGLLYGARAIDREIHRVRARSRVQAFARLPLWVIFIVVVRAGMVEELFYRAYSIERLKGLGFGRTASWAIPLVIFGAAHWSGGAANIAIALVLGLF